MNCIICQELLYDCVRYEKIGKINFIYSVYFKLKKKQYKLMTYILNLQCTSLFTCFLWGMH